MISNKTIRSQVFSCPTIISDAHMPKDVVEKDKKPGNTLQWQLLLRPPAPPGGNNINISQDSTCWAAEQKINIFVFVSLVKDD